MLNTDIFKFEFVDRTKEREIIDEYVSDFSKTLGYALWLHGKRGTGKSFFLTEHVTTKTDFTSVYINIEINSASSGTYIKEFIANLSKAADLKFASYLRANYKSIAAIGQKAFNVALNLAELDDTGLDELGASLANHFISKHSEKENTETVVRKYVAEALKKRGNLVFILDNFSQCDNPSLEVIASVIHDLLGERRIKFIICTTDDDIENRFDIKSVLAEKIPNKPIEIQAFQDKQLFVRMLENTFDLDESNVKLLVQAFKLCQGIPQHFKEILINLYSAQGIIVNEDKAQFVADTFQQILVKGEISFDIDALCQEQKSAKTLLLIIAFWGAPVSSKILFGFLEFYANIEPVPLFKEEAIKALQYLENLHVIARTLDKHEILLHFEHDSLKLAVSEYFRDDTYVPFLHFSIYEYLMVCEGDSSKLPYWRQNYQSLRAYHSYAAQADGWLEYNYTYGCTFFDAEIYKEAEFIFTRLESAVASLSGEQLFTIGRTLFYCGKYSKANDVLSNILSRGLLEGFSTELAAKFYIFQARVSFCMLESRNAINAITQAESLGIKTENPLYVTIMGAKQSILYLSPGGFPKAKAIFDELSAKNMNIREMAIVYQSAMDYYEGDKSQGFLEKGLALAKQFSDHITEGKILNNMGFECLRCGNYEKARQFYKDSILILKEWQPHEQVFPYSNLAVLNMILEEWEQAFDNIVEALFWNKSDYASLVLKTNRMLCYYYSENQQWEKLYQELYDYIFTQHSVDDKIYKKICINMALLASKDSRHVLDAGKLLACCLPRLETEWPHGKYRFLKLYQKIEGKKVDLVLPPETRYVKYYCELEFEPWLINFSHD